jgi:hypothetical protein
VRLPFRGRAEVLVTGAPVLDSAISAEP